MNGCIKCLNKNYCQKCDTNKFVTSDDSGCKGSCDTNGEYSDTNYENNPKCKKCSIAMENCIKCSSKSVCLKCDSTKVKKFLNSDSTGCIEQCNHLKSTYEDKSNSND